MNKMMLQIIPSNLDFFDMRPQDWVNAIVIFLLKHMKIEIFFSAACTIFNGSKMTTMNSDEVKHINQCVMEAYYDSCITAKIN